MNLRGSVGEYLKQGLEAKTGQRESHEAAQKRRLPFEFLMRIINESGVQPCPQPELFDEQTKCFEYRLGLDSDGDVSQQLLVAVRKRQGEFLSATLGMRLSRQVDSWSEMLADIHSPKESVDTFAGIGISNINKKLDDAAAAKFIIVSIVEAGKRLGIDAPKELVEVVDGINAGSDSVVRAA